jgi:hypothetical protein
VKTDAQRAAHAKYMREYSKRPGKKEKKAELDRRYREGNYEKVQVRKKQEYEAKGEYIRARVARYRIVNLEKIRQQKREQYTTFKQEFAREFEWRITRLGRGGRSAARRSLVQEMLTWAGQRHSYWVESQIQRVVNPNQEES